MFPQNTGISQNNLVQFSQTTQLMLLILLFLSSALCQFLRQQCLPFGVRLALGRNFYQSAETEIISIRFNTRAECQKSFIAIEMKGFQQQMECQTDKIAFKKYSSYIHKCSINFLEEGQQFLYMVYGWKGNDPSQKKAYANSFIQAKVIDRNDPSVKVLVLADWGDQNKYQKLSSAFSSLLSSKNQPDLVYLNGDYSYDLSSYNGRNYQIFLNMLSQISPFWPCIFNIGNHEHNSYADYLIFSKSFQHYDLAENGITSLNLGTFTFLISDPFNVIYEDGEKQKFINTTLNHIQKAKSRPIVASTHYPMACGGGCNIQKQYFKLVNTFKELFDTYIDNNIILYIGSHVHTYERYFPFKKSGEFQLIQSPYIFSNVSKYLISVVEGVAGNREVMSQYINVSNIIKAVYPEATGYGILTVDRNQLNYQHFLAKSYQNAADSFTIVHSELIEKPKNIREQIGSH